VVDVKENPRLADIRLVNGTLMLRNIPWRMPNAHLFGRARGLKLLCG
jgi:hypothetical protein